MARRGRCGKEREVWQGEGGMAPARAAQTQEALGGGRGGKGAWRPHSTPLPPVLIVPSPPPPSLLSFSFLLPFLAPCLLHSSNKTRLNPDPPFPTHTLPLQPPQAKRGCRLYRAEAVPPPDRPDGPPYGLLQGSLAGVVGVPPMESLAGEVPGEG